MTIHDFLEKNKIAYNEWYRLVYQERVYHIKWDYSGNFIVRRPNADMKNCLKEYKVSNANIQCDANIQCEAILNPEKLIPLKVYKIIAPVWFYVDPINYLNYPIRGYKEKDGSIYINIAVDQFATKWKWINVEKLGLFSLPEREILREYLKYTTIKLLTI